MKLAEIVKPGSVADRDAPGVKCNGINHSHYGTLATCTNCGDEVARGDKGGIFPIREYTTEAGNPRRVYSCYRPSHVCDPTMIEVQRRLVADDLNRGTPVVGAPVKVVKGRKVPVGTVGIVRWRGDNGWGPRVGIAVEGEPGLKYTAEANVAIDLDDELRAEVLDVVNAERARVEKDALALTMAEAAAKVRAGLVADVAERLAAGTLVGKRVKRYDAHGALLDESEITGGTNFGTPDAIAAGLLDPTLPSWVLEVRSDDGRVFAYTDMDMGDRFRFVSL